MKSSQHQIKQVAESILEMIDAPAAPADHASIDDVKTSMSYALELLAALKLSPHSATVAHLAEVMTVMSCEIEAVEAKLINIFSAMAELTNLQQCVDCGFEE